MKKYLGGYANIDLTSETIYNDLLALKDIDKTILLYDPNETKPYFIDTIVYDTNSIVLTKGGKTITIANDNTITSSGDVVLNHLYKIDFNFKIVDENVDSLGVIYGSIISNKNTLTKDDFKVEKTNIIYGAVFNANGDNTNPIRICLECAYSEGNYCYITMSDYNADTDQSDIDYNMTNSELTIDKITQLI